MFELMIQPDDGEPFEVSAGMRDVRLWEKTHPKRGLGQLQDGAGISAVLLFEIAYSACRRQKRIPAELTEDEFCEAYEIDVETPQEKAARLRAQALRDDLLAVDEDDEDVPNDLDPTPAAP